MPKSAPLGAITREARSPRNIPFCQKLIKPNVSDLRLARSYMAPGRGGKFSFNPLIVDGVMYVVGKTAQLWPSMPRQDAKSGHGPWKVHRRIGALITGRIMMLISLRKCNAVYVRSPCLLRLSKFGLLLPI